MVRWHYSPSQKTLLRGRNEKSGYKSGYGSPSRFQQSPIGAGCTPATLITGASHERCPPGSDPHHAGDHLHFAADCRLALGLAPVYGSDDLGDHAGGRYLAAAEDCTSAPPARAIWSTRSAGRSARATRGASSAVARTASGGTPGSSPRTRSRSSTTP